MKYTSFYCELRESSSILLPFCIYTQSCRFVFYTGLMSLFLMSLLFTALKVASDTCFHLNLDRGILSSECFI